MFTSGYMISCRDPSLTVLAFAPSLAFRAHIRPRQAHSAIRRTPRQPRLGTAYDQRTASQALRNHRAPLVGASLATTLREALGLLSEDIGHIQDLYLRTILPIASAWLLYLVAIIALGFFHRPRCMRHGAYARRGAVRHAACIRMARTARASCARRRSPPSSTTTFRQRLRSFGLGLLGRSATTISADTRICRKKRAASTRPSSGITAYATFCSRSSSACAPWCCFFGPRLPSHPKNPHQDSRCRSLRSATKTHPPMRRTGSRRSFCASSP